MMTQCPRCQQEEAKVVGEQRAVCSLCSKALQRVYQFCWACQREWPGENPGNSCSLPGCALRAALLSPQAFTDPLSSVWGAPFFRACPSCKTLLTHSGGGCSCVVCHQCQTCFCFRCLREDCGGSYPVEYRGEDDDDYDGDYDDSDIDDYCADYMCSVVDNSKALEALGF